MGATSCLASLSTFLLHVESRIASACGQGFYTIGPCGLTRSLGTGKSFEEIFLDRARGIPCPPWTL